MRILVVVDTLVQCTAGQSKYVLHKGAWTHARTDAHMHASRIDRIGVMWYVVSRATGATVPHHTQHNTTQHNLTFLPRM